MIITSPVEFGKIVRSRRKALGLTQTDLAMLTGVGLRFISELERGKESAHFGYALKVAANLGIDLFAKQRGEK